jgi:hypothetical protein
MDDECHPGRYRWCEGASYGDGGLCFPHLSLAGAELSPVHSWQSAAETRKHDDGPETKPQTSSRLAAPVNFPFYLQAAVSLFFASATKCHSCNSLLALRLEASKHLYQSDLTRPSTFGNCHRRSSFWPRVQRESESALPKRLSGSSCSTNLYHRKEAQVS